MLRKKSNHFFQVVADEAIMGIMAFERPDLRCVYVNKIAGETLELPSDAVPEDLITLASLIPKEVRGNLRPISPELLKYEGLFQDVLIMKANDVPFIANLGVKHLHLEDGSEILLLMFQDITFQKKLQREITLKQDELKQAYEELLDQNKQLRELDNAKNRFIALITHELRTPLSAMIATAEVLNLKLYDDEAQHQEFVGTIHEQGLQLLDLVNDILDFAKIQAGKMDFYIEHLSLKPLLARMAETYQSMADQYNVTVHIDVPDESELCWFDHLRMREVVQNILSNAIKYNRDEGSVHIWTERDEDFTRIHVKDTGRGIPADKIQHVFNEFETVGHVSKHHKGTGLGMPISKRLIESMGGQITIESVEGVGTTFTVFVPNQKILDESVYRVRPDLGADLAA